MNFPAGLNQPGARFDYEQYRKKPRYHETPMLRGVYPIDSSSSRGDRAMGYEIKGLKKNGLLNPNGKKTLI